MEAVPPVADADKTTRLGLGMLGAAFALGALGDWLLRGLPWGLNVPVWTLALDVAAAAPRLRRALRRGGRGLPGAGDAALRLGHRRSLRPPGPDRPARLARRRAAARRAAGPVVDDVRDRRPRPPCARDQ